MQARHRKRHRLMWIVLGPLAVAAFVYALANRVEMPVMQEVPGAGEKEAAP